MDNLQEQSLVIISPEVHQLVKEIQPTVELWLQHQRAEADKKFVRNPEDHEKLMAKSEEINQQRDEYSFPYEERLPQHENTDRAEYISRRGALGNDTVPRESLLNAVQWPEESQLSKPQQEAVNYVFQTNSNIGKRRRSKEGSFEYYWRKHVRQEDVPQDKVTIISKRVFETGSMGDLLSLLDG